MVQGTAQVAPSKKLNNCARWCKAVGSEQVATIETAQLPAPGGARQVGVGTAAELQTPVPGGDRQVGTGIAAELAQTPAPGGARQDGRWE